jgi:16S rRNA (cytosine1402-N4)-methyltransferase
MGASMRDAEPGPHAPVLYQQVLSALEPRAGGRYIDGTLGGGGHAQGILAAAEPDGELLGLDRDPEALALAGRRLAPFSERIHLRHASFVAMDVEATALGWDGVDGILLDLGLSSMQLDEARRGFSFRLDGPLDMRFDISQPLTADDIVNGWDEAELAEALRRYGEQPRAGAVARAIVRSRPVHSTTELAKIVARAAGRSRRGIHPATLTFQALRIVVNEELESLRLGLEKAVGLLRPRGRLVVISFHSLEDRLVKQFLRRESSDCICPPGRPICTCGHRAALRLLTRRPIRPERSRIANPRRRRPHAGGRTS